MRTLAEEIPQTGASQQKLIQAKKIEFIFEQISGVVVASNIAVGILVFILWGRVPKEHLYAWMIIVFIATAVMPILLKRQFLRADNANRDSRYWEVRTTMVGFGAGLSWGLSGYVFFLTDLLEYQLILFLFLMGAAAAAMTTTVGYKPHFYATAIPMLLPIAYRSAIEFDPLHSALSMMTLVYLGAITYFYNNVHNTMAESLRLRYENLDLVHALTRKNEEVQRASLAKSRFLAAASHDLRQPLHAQALFVAELKSRIEDTETRLVLGYLEDSMSTMREMFNGLLDISKLDAGVVKPSWENFSIQYLLARLQTEFAPQMAQKGLLLRVVPCNAIVRSDPGLLERILRNLLSNAVRYTHTGSVLIGCRRRGDQVSVQVRDSGQGIPPDQLGSIFEEFYQVDNPERDREKGLGLGLAIVSRLSELLQHPVHVVSMLHKGTVFSIDLPVADDLTESISEINCKDGNPGRLIGITICVIEDDMTVCSAMRRLLTSWGCKPLVVSSASEAVAELLNWRHPPDLIIADYRLRQGETGVKAIEKVQRQFKLSIPALLVTGDTAPDRIQEALASGYRLLHKPVEPEKMYELLVDLLRSPHPVMLLGHNRNRCQDRDKPSNEAA